MVVLNKPWPTAEEIELAQAPPFKRDWCAFDLSECDHKGSTAFTIAYAGSWRVDLCHDCGEIISKHCECSIGMYPNQVGTCEWNEDGTLLRCRICGMDGT